MKSLLSKILVAFLSFLLSFTSFTQPSNATPQYDDDIAYSIVCLRPKTKNQTFRPAIINFNILPQTEEVKKLTEYTGVISLIGVSTRKLYGRGYFKLFADYSVTGGSGSNFRVSRKSTGTIRIYTSSSRTMDGVDGFITLFDASNPLPSESLEVSVNGKLKFVYGNGVKEAPVVDFRKVTGFCYNLEDRDRDWNGLKYLFIEAQNLLDDLVELFKKIPPILIPKPGQGSNDGGWFPGPSF